MRLTLAVLPLHACRYALGALDVFRACFTRELILLKRHMFIYVFRTASTAVMGIVAGTLFIRPRMHGNTATLAARYAAVRGFLGLQPPSNMRAWAALLACNLLVRHLERVCGSLNWPIVSCLP
jgi:hypothetical protein